MYRAKIFHESLKFGKMQLLQVSETVKEEFC